MTTSVAVPTVDRSPWPGDQIAAYYRERIDRGEIAVGDLLPPARKIQEEWGVGIKTVVRAMRILREEGLIQTRPAKAPLVVAAPQPDVPGP